jgi:hypothetical protein
MELSKCNPEYASINDLHHGLHNDNYLLQASQTWALDKASGRALECVSPQVELYLAKSKILHITTPGGPGDDRQYVASPVRDSSTRHCKKASVDTQQIAERTERRYIFELASFLAVA